MSLPRPEEITSALATFPPKLSVMQKVLSAPEILFENAVKSATGFELPPGPNKILVSLMESFESGAPALPTLALPGITPAPTAPASEATPSTVVGKKKFELL